MTQGGQVPRGVGVILIMTGVALLIMGHDAYIGGRSERVAWIFVAAAALTIFLGVMIIALDGYALRTALRRIAKGIILASLSIGLAAMLVADLILAKLAGSGQLYSPALGIDFTPNPALRILSGGMLILMFAFTFAAFVKARIYVRTHGFA